MPFLSASLSDCLGALKWAVSESNLKHPLVVLLLGANAYLIKEMYERHQQRIRLLTALLNETETARNTIEATLDHLQSWIGAAECLLGQVDEMHVTYEELNKLPSGFCLFAPTISYSDVISKLRPSESKTTIAYLDAWSRLTDFEKRYAGFYMKFVDLVPLVGDTARTIQIREVAELVRGTLEQIRGVLNDLAKARQKLEGLARAGTAWNGLKPRFLSATPKRAEVPVANEQHEVKKLVDALKSDG